MEQMGAAGVATDDRWTLQILTVIAGSTKEYRRFETGLPLSQSAANLKRTYLH